MADRNGEQALIPKRGEMEALIARVVQPVTQTEELPFWQANGRVCAEDVFGVNTLPNRPTSRFDGIGVRWADFAAGIPDTGGWREGREYVFCNTGIAIPEGYDTVIAIEETRFEDGRLTILEKPAAKGALVNETGSSMRQGEKLAAAGAVITPADIGLFASGGALRVSVYAKPKVAVIPTGNELVPPTGELPPGRNIESNSYMIAAYLEQWGCEAERWPIVEDEPEAIADAIREELAAHDAVIAIAGSSLGTKDYTVRVLAGMGRQLVPELAHGPGRKSSLTLVDGKPVLGVAGPPLGAQITCDLYLAPLVSALRGLPPVGMQKLAVVTDDAVRQHEVDFCERVHIYRAEDGCHMRSLFALSTTRAEMQMLANGNFYRPAGTACRPGDRVEVELLGPASFLPQADQTIALR